jgi:hypothetical protein
MTVVVTAILFTSNESRLVRQTENLSTTTEPLTQSGTVNNYKYIANTYEPFV